MIRLIKQSEEQMLYGNILVLHPVCRCFRAAERRVQIARQVGFAAAAAHARKFFKDRVAGCPERFHIHIHPLQHTGDQTVLLREQSVQQMRLPHLGLTVLNGILLCGLHGLDAFLCQFLYVHGPTSYVKGSPGSCADNRHTGSLPARSPSPADPDG